MSSPDAAQACTEDRPLPASHDDAWGLRLPPHGGPSAHAPCQRLHGAHSLPNGLRGRLRRSRPPRGARAAVERVHRDGRHGPLLRGSRPRSLPGQSLPPAARLGGRLPHHPDQDHDPRAARDARAASAVWRRSAAASSSSRAPRARASRRRSRPSSTSSTRPTASTSSPSRTPSSSSTRRRSASSISARSAPTPRASPRRSKAAGREDPDLILVGRDARHRDHLHGPLCRREGHHRLRHAPHQQRRQDRRPHHLRLPGERAGRHPQRPRRHASRRRRPAAHPQARRRPCRRHRDPLLLSRHRQHDPRGEDLPDHLRHPDRRQGGDDRHGLVHPEALRGEEDLRPCRVRQGHRQVSLQGRSSRRAARHNDLLAAPPAPAAPAHRGRPAPRRPPPAPPRPAHTARRDRPTRSVPVAAGNALPHPLRARVAPPSVAG